MTAVSDLATRERARAHDLDQDVAERLLRREVITLRLAADAAAGTTVAKHTLLSFPAAQYPNGVEVKDIKLRTAAAVTESDSVFATHTFERVDSLGAAVTGTTATLTTKTVAQGGIGTTVAHRPYAATLHATVANRFVPAGGALTLTQAKESTGTQLPLLAYEVTVEAV